MSDTPTYSDVDDQSTDTGVLSDGPSRRSFMKAAGATAGGLALGTTGLSGSASAEPQIPTPQLGTDGNLIVDPDGNTVTLRGVNIIDARRADTLAPTRGKNAVQMVDNVTGEGWHTQVVRLPLQPSDIAQTTTGYAQGPLEPGSFDDSDLETYLEEHVDDVVERCRERGVYVILDYHRHWTGSSASSHETDFDGYWADSDSLEIHEELQQEVVDFWDVVAARYGDMDHTLFEVYNEPTEPGIWGNPAPEGDQGPDSHWTETWVAFVDFVQPMVDKIEEHTDNLQLLGSPSWTQTPEGIMLTEENLPDWSDYEFRQLDEPENLAMTFHIYPGHNSSMSQDWDDPTLNGEGVDEVYEEYPLFVTEFGWDGTLISNTLRGDTATFGEPFFDWMEQSDAISYTAWCADIWWDTTMFERAFDGTDTDIENPYEADVPQDCPELPCEWNLRGEDVGDPADHMGKYVKDQLAQYKDHNNPGGDAGSTSPASPSDAWANEVTETTIEMEWDSVSEADAYNVYLQGDLEASTSDTTYTFEDLEPGTAYVIGIAAENDDGESITESTTVTTEGGAAESCGGYDAAETLENGQVVCDVDGDGNYMDVTGDGSVSNSDVTEFFGNQHVDPWDSRTDLFDFTGDGEVSQADVVELFANI